MSSRIFIRLEGLSLVAQESETERMSTRGLKREERSGWVGMRCVGGGLGAKKTGHILTLIYLWTRLKPGSVSFSQPCGLCTSKRSKRLRRSQCPSSMNCFVNTQLHLLKSMSSGGIDILLSTCN